MTQETCSNLARISFVSVFAAFLCGCCLNIGTMNNPNDSRSPAPDATTKLLIGLIPVVIAGVGLVSGLTSVLVGIRNRYSGILPMGISGIVLNLAFFAFVAYTFILIRNLAAEGKLPLP